MGKEVLYTQQFTQIEKSSLTDTVILWQNPELQKKKELVAYESAFDRETYLKLALLQYTDPQQYFEKKTTLDRYTTRQLETHLGERFNVLLSTVRYDLQDGQIYLENSSESLVDVMKRGRDYRRKHGSPIDWPREDAEIVGVTRIQETLGDPLVAIGSMMFSISPRGGKDSIYQHNFYDIFTLKKDGSGERYIEMRRYSSALDIDDYKRILSQKMPSYAKTAIFTPEYLLAHPIAVHPDFSPEDLHREFHKNHTYTSVGDFEKIRHATRPYIDFYIKHLTQNPYDEWTQRKMLRAIWNAGDEFAEKLKKGESVHRFNNDGIVILADINRLGNKKVRTVMTACGKSGDDQEDSSTLFENPLDKLLKALTPFSVGDFGELKDDLGDRVFKCPSCKHNNIRPYNKKIPRCQNEECPDPTKVAC